MPCKTKSTAGSGYSGSLGVASEISRSEGKETPPEGKSKVERRGLNKEQSDYDRWYQVVGTACPLVRLRSS